MFVKVDACGGVRKDRIKNEYLSGNILVAPIYEKTNNTISGDLIMYTR